MYEQFSSVRILGVLSLKIRLNREYTAVSRAHSIELAKRFRMRSENNISALIKSDSWCNLSSCCEVFKV